jgi:hypothetical protein
MKVPDWYSVILLSLAAWRVFQLLAWDTILEGPRRWLFRISSDWDGESPITDRSYRETLALFVQCPYCAGFWIAVAWWVAWYFFPTETVFVAVPWALSAGVIGADKLLSSE